MSGADAGMVLVRALERSADLAGIALTLASNGWTRWASATFNGARHELVVDVAADAASRAWLDALPEAELSVRGHLVADLKVVGVRTAAARLSVVLEVLTVEDA